MQVDPGPKCTLMPSVSETLKAYHWRFRVLQRPTAQEMIKNSKYFWNFPPIILLDTNKFGGKFKIILSLPVCLHFEGRRTFNGMPLVPEEVVSHLYPPLSSKVTLLMTNWLKVVTIPIWYVSTWCRLESVDDILIGCSTLRPRS